jgi:hypothetical protein
VSVKIDYEHRTITCGTDEEKEIYVARTGPIPLDYTIKEIRDDHTE